MNRLAQQIATTFAIVGLMAASSAFAQQAVTAAAESAGQQTHSDPLVQKRQEVRDANRQQRQRRSEARQNFRAEAREARAERNESAQQSRERASAAKAEQAAQGNVHPSRTSHPQAVQQTMQQSMQQSAAQLPAHTAQ